METKLELKIKAFEYILYKLKQWNNDFKENEKTRLLTKKQHLALLFIVCMANKDDDRTIIFSIFDNFFALEEGIIEKDIWDNYNDIVMPETLPSRYEGIPYNIINDSIDHLKSLNKRIIHHPEKSLIDFTKGHLSWLIFTESKTQKIATEHLIHEKSVYANSNMDKNLIFG